MNKFQYKILEAFGIYNKNRSSFSEFSKKNVLGKSEIKITPKIPSLFCAQNGRCLTLVDSWFRESGMYLSWGALVGVVLFSAFFYVFFIMPFFVDIPWDIVGYITVFFMSLVVMASVYPLFFVAGSELKRGLQYVVFNRESKNVYFVSSVDFKPKICRWKECTFCIAYSAGSIEGYYYELRGYLLNEDGSVRDSFSFDDYHYMTVNSEQQRQSMIEDLSARFEYVRRFMEEGADSVEPVTGHLDLKPSLSEAAHRFQPKSKTSDGKKFHIIYSIVRTVFLIPFSVQVVGHYFFCRYCRLPEWPQSVIDECGKEVFPRR